MTHFGHWVQPPRRQATGPAPKLRWMPLPALLYAQVIKTTRRRRLVRVSYRVVCGTCEAVQLALFQVYYNFVLPHLTCFDHFDLLRLQQSNSG